jgi:hypothetical protein
MKNVSKREMIKINHQIIKTNRGPGVAVHTYNPSYLGDRATEDLGLRLSWQKVSETTSSLISEV